MMMCLTKGKAAISQARVQEFVRGGGGAKSESLFFLLFNFSGGGSSENS